MISRRTFLKGAAAAVPMIVSAKALGLEGPGANEVVNVGLIGLGGRCADIVKNSVGIPQMRIVAVCDIFQPDMDAFMKNQPEGQTWKQYTDFREMIEKEKLDGVMIETPTHCRAWITCQAMAMGMDAYIEKPMSLTIAEGRDMVKFARHYKRVTQVGTQQRSMPLNNWASDLVMNGAIGKVKEVYAPNFIAPLTWTPKPGEPMPAGGSDTWWDVWTNQAEMRPYRDDIHHGWATWKDYDGGGISFGVTGWGTHSYDQVQRGLGTSETGPVEIVLEEAVADSPAGNFTDRPIGDDETGAPYYQMLYRVNGKEKTSIVGPRAKVRMKYANGAELKLHLDADKSPGLGCRFVGEKGSIEINRDKIWGDPQEIVSGKDRPEPLKVPETQPHIENWVNCIKSREKCNADIEYGLRSTSVCYLVNIARDVNKVGEVLKWDPEAERFTNCDEGNAMLSRERRKGYELPKLT
jgi:predicted dehydrogenase